LQGRLAASFHAARSRALSGILERTTVEQRHGRKIQAAAEGSRRSARSQARRDPKGALTRSIQTNGRIHDRARARAHGKCAAQEPATTCIFAIEIEIAQREQEETRALIRCAADPAAILPLAGPAAASQANFDLGIAFAMQDVDRHVFAMSAKQ